MIFADEPTGALDTQTAADVLELLREPVRTQGQTVVMVTHDPVAASYADQVVFLADGVLAGSLHRPDRRTGRRPDDPPRRAFAASPAGGGPMMRLAVRTLRFRKGGFIATFVAVVFGTGDRDGLRRSDGDRVSAPTSTPSASPPLHSLSPASKSHLRPGAEDATPLPERVGVPAELVAKIRSVEGVSDVIGDLTFPASVGCQRADGC